MSGCRGRKRRRSVFHGVIATPFSPCRSASGRLRPRKEARDDDGPRCRWNSEGFRQVIMSLRVATYNIHKGFSQFNRRMVLHELRERLRETKADIVFLQEVQGQHALHANRFTNWPAEPQYEFLADSMWAEHAYGRNAVYDHGHHGNAILSRYPIISVENQDISTNRFESRGLLHCEIHVPRLDIKVHCLCVHFALIE